MKTTSKPIWTPTSRTFRDRMYALRLLWLRRKTFVWRKELYKQTVRLAIAMERRWFPAQPMTPIGGKMLQFIPSGRNLGHDVLSVLSVRGTMGMGTVEWSNQWNRPRFKAHPEAVFDQQCVAEIYAAMRDLK